MTGREALYRRATRGRGAAAARYSDRVASRLPAPALDFYPSWSRQPSRLMLQARADHSWLHLDGQPHRHLPVTVEPEQLATLRAGVVGVYISIYSETVKAGQPGRSHKFGYLPLFWES